MRSRRMMGKRLSFKYLHWLDTLVVGQAMMSYPIHQHVIDYLSSKILRSSLVFGPLSKIQSDKISLA
jgi:hypothetical protein